MFTIFYLSNCGYSMKTLKTIKDNNFPSRNIKCDRNNGICSSDPDLKIIPETYTSYPKILFQIKDKKIFIGGNQELDKIMDILKEIKKNPDIVIQSQRFIKQSYLYYILLKLILL